MLCFMLKYLVCVFIFIGVIMFQSLTFRGQNQVIHQSVSNALFQDTDLVDGNGLIKIAARDTLSFPGKQTTDGRYIRVVPFKWLRIDTHQHMYTYNTRYHGLV